MTRNNSTLAYRVGQLEKETDGLNTKMDTLLTNHLPHLEQSILEVKTRVNVLTAVNIGAVILGVIVSKYL